jgi:hypothetical protein
MYRGRWLLARRSGMEAATGNRDFFLNKPPGARCGDVP